MVTVEYGLLWKRRRMIVDLLVLLFSIEIMLCCNRWPPNKLTMCSPRLALNFLRHNWRNWYQHNYRAFWARLGVSFRRNVSMSGVTTVCPLDSCIKIPHLTTATNRLAHSVDSQSEWSESLPVGEVKYAKSFPRWLHSLVAVMVFCFFSISHCILESAKWLLRAS